MRWLTWPLPGLITLAWLCLFPFDSTGAELPTGEGVELVKFHCRICHNLKLVSEQELSRERWGEVLKDMKKNGALFNEEQRKIILGYLSAFLAPPETDPKAELPEGEGKSLVKVHCGICHNLALVKSQRLSRDVWGEVLDDMKENGAPFNGQQREVILTYLEKYLGT